VIRKRRKEAVADDAKQPRCRLNEEPAGPIGGRERYPEC
jgi:hypothetical protein